MVWVTCTSVKALLMLQGMYQCWSNYAAIQITSFAGINKDIPEKTMASLLHELQWFGLMVQVSGYWADPPAVQTCLPLKMNGYQA